MSGTAEASRELELSRLPEPSQLEILFKLPENTIDPNGLDLTPTHQLTYEQWEEIGHYIGRFSRWSRFALGDWLNYGAEAFAENDAWAQATEANPQERYDVAHRVTGLKVETLRNYASLCDRIKVGVRRVELGFSEHEPVAALDPEDQSAWLARAVEESWDRGQLRDAIRESRNPQPFEGGDAPPEVLPVPQMSIGERAFDLVQLVVNQGQPTSDNGLLVSAEIAAQCRALVGEE